MIEVIYGTASVDLFDGPTDGTRTFHGDGRWLTADESFDSESFCNDFCAAAALESNGWTESDDTPGTWWIKQPGRRDGRYDTAEMYDDVECYDEQAPYVCHYCDEVLYEAPDDEVDYGDGFPTNAQLADDAAEYAAWLEEGKRFAHLIGK